MLNALAVSHLFLVSNQVSCLVKNKLGTEHIRMGSSLQRNAVLIVALFMVVLCAAEFSAFLVNAKGSTSQAIRILADGTVEPSSVPIQRNGDTYVFTDDVFARGIVVEKAGITLDGASHRLMGPYNGTQSLWIVGEGPNQPVTNDSELWSIGIDLATNEVSGLTIKNLDIRNFSIGIFLWSSNNLVIDNNITEGVIGLMVAEPNNRVVGNLIANNENGFFSGQTGGSIPLNNTLSDNKFVNNLRQLGGCVCIDFNTSEPTHYWDNGGRGNFWSDYNGTDSDGDGIGDTPYVIDVLNQDRFPLVSSSAIVPANVFVDVHILAAVGVAVLAAIAVLVVVLRRRKQGSTILPG
jgi:nitrous oxidase accessory protein NosD